MRSCRDTTLGNSTDDILLTSAERPFHDVAKPQSSRIFIHTTKERPHTHSRVLDPIKNTKEESFFGSIHQDGGVHEQRGEGAEPGAGPAHQAGIPPGAGDHQAPSPRHRQPNPPPSIDGQQHEISDYTESKSLGSN